MPKSRRQNGRNIARTCKSSRAGDCFALYLIYSATFIVSSSMRLTLVSRSGAGYLAVFKSGFQLLGLAIAHLDIVAGENLVGVVAVDAPICCDHALEAPLVAEHLVSNS